VVEVSDRDRVRAVIGVDVGTWTEATDPVSEQDRDAGGAVVGDREVGYPVTVQVTNRNGDRQHAGLIVEVRQELDACGSHRTLRRRDDGAREDWKQSDEEPGSTTEGNEAVVAKTE